MKQCRKKICPVCGRKLWLHSFYKCASGYSSHCKECVREEKRQEYARNRKVPDGCFFHEAKGRLVEHKGYSTRILWTGNMLSLLKRYYPTTRNEELAELIGVSPRTVTRKARELGLVKDPDWLKEVYNYNRRDAQAASKRKGYPGSFQPGCRTGEKYWFKKKMSEKSISISKEQVIWLREMYETYRALLEGTPDDGNAAELKQVKKHVLPLIKELEKITK